MIRLLMAAMLLAACSAPAAQKQPGFAFSPVPRWAEEPETEEVCAAIEKECPGMWASDSIEAEFGYDALYDVAGNLVGMRMTRSTGCKPLDEHMLLGQAHFKLVFHKDGQPDLDNIHAELEAGVDPAKVRIVKADGTSLTMGCH